VCTPPNSSVKLVPGMPVETFMKPTTAPSISYFTKPLQDQILRAFRES
jgi:HlyD family secretion protein